MGLRNPNVLWPSSLRCEYLQGGFAPTRFVLEALCLECDILWPMCKSTVQWRRCGWRISLRIPCSNPMMHNFRVPRSAEGGLLCSLACISCIVWTGAASVPLPRPAASRRMHRARAFTQWPGQGGALDEVVCCRSGHTKSLWVAVSGV